MPILLPVLLFAAAAVTPEAGATPAEPEVIKKGKKEEEAPAEEKEKGKKK